MCLAKLIREEREKKGLSLRQLARESGVSYMTLHEWEHSSGTNRMRVDKLDAVLKVLGRSYSIGAQEQLMEAGDGTDDDIRHNTENVQDLR